MSETDRIKSIYVRHSRLSLRYPHVISFPHPGHYCRASNMIEHKVIFCKGKVTSFVALSHDAGVPAHIAF